MDIGEYKAEVEGNQVSIFRGTICIAVAKWTGRRILGIPKSFSQETDDGEQALIRAIEQGLIAEAEAELAAMNAAAYDENGEDISLTRWMLSLTPGERLRVMEEHRASIQRMMHGKIQR